MRTIPEQDLLYFADKLERAMRITIYHNCACSKSRNTLAMIRQSGVDDRGHASVGREGAR